MERVRTILPQISLLVLVAVIAVGGVFSLGGLF